jgi:hypothetical protein
MYARKVVIGGTVIICCLAGVLGQLTRSRVLVRLGSTGTASVGIAVSDIVCVSPGRSYHAKLNSR